MRIKSVNLGFPSHPIIHTRKSPLEPSGAASETMSFYLELRSDPANVTFVCLPIRTLPFQSRRLEPSL